MNDNPNNEKLEIAVFMRSLHETSAGNKLLRCLDIMLNELREANDNAKQEDVLKNQGGIDIVKQLQAMITRENPALKYIFEERKK